MNIISAFSISLKALSINKMRSALTMLGIIIGVAAVIAMLSVGTGASKQIAEQISSIGSNLIMILPGTTTAGGVRMGVGTHPTLTLDDAEAILRESPAVADVAPLLTGVAQAVYGHQNWATGVAGTTHSILNVREWKLRAGRPFTEQDVKSAAKVCLLGQTVVENLFGDINPIDKIIRIKKVPFTVIGVLERKGQTPTGMDQDDTIYIPVTTAQRKVFGSPLPGMVRVIMVKAKNTENMRYAEDQIKNLLRQRHHIGPKEENDFSVRNLTEMMQTQQESIRVMTILLGIIASISLIVGGIGIMNIMLVSVTERTREIGIRIAVGAKVWDIRFQFMIEALILSLIGGIIGIAIGILSSNILSTLTDWPVIISPLSILLAFGFSGVVGIFFGFYPAYKASLLNPIDALRYQ